MYVVLPIITPTRFDNPHYYWLILVRDSGMFYHPPNRATRIPKASVNPSYLAFICDRVADFLIFNTCRMHINHTFCYSIEDLLNLIFFKQYIWGLTFFPISDFNPSFHIYLIFPGCTKVLIKELFYEFTVWSKCEVCHNSLFLISGLSLRKSLGFKEKLRNKKKMLLRNS